MADDSSWSDSLLRACGDYNIEVFSPQRVASLRGPVVGIAVLVTRPWKELASLFHRLALHARQPSVVVHLPPLPGAARCIAYLAHLGYHRIIQDEISELAVSTVAEQIDDVITCRAWVVGPFTRGLVKEDPIPELAPLLAAAVESPTATRTVRSWARQVDMVSWELRNYFRRSELPPPKRVLDRLRLSLVVGYQATENAKLTRRDLARRIGYSSGRYLGRCAKRITGDPLGELLDSSATDVIRRLGASAWR